MKLTSILRAVRPSSWCRTLGLTVLGLVEQRSLFAKMRSHGSGACAGRHELS